MDQFLRRMTWAIAPVIAVFAMTSCQHVVRHPADTTMNNADSTEGQASLAYDTSSGKTPEGVKKGDTRLPKRVSVLYHKNSMLLGPEDVIAVKIADHPELNANIVVDPWGFVKLPYIDEFRVQGLTVDVVKEILTQKYSEFFLKAPKVDVNVEQYNSQVVYVLGAVFAEGRYPLVKGRPMTLRDAMVVARLPNPRAALWRVWIIRQTDTGPVFQHVNLYRIMYRGQVKDDVPLMAGDIVYVPMTVLDTITTFLGRVVSPVFGSTSRALTSAAIP